MHKEIPSFRLTSTVISRQRAWTSRDVHTLHISAFGMCLLPITGHPESDYGNSNYLQKRRAKSLVMLAVTREGENNSGRPYFRAISLCNLN